MQDIVQYDIIVAHHNKTVPDYMYFDIHVHVWFISFTSKINLGGLDSLACVSVLIFRR